MQQAIHEALIARAEASEAFDEQDEGNEEARLLEYRFRVLQSKMVEDFGVGLEAVQGFLTWRQRQIVIFASGVRRISTTAWPTSSDDR